nr:retrovirus-related Pol polyprotein from transposon TNT 1-94 [Tanacetum cinerariifolium]
APYSPQQNGVVERKNRTILNMVRSMLRTKKMPKEFWAKAVDCAVYLLNRCSSKSLYNKTPQEAWNGLKPTVSHLLVFGSIVYGHVPSQRRLKLDDKSEKHVFVGYDKQSKGYKLYNPITRKVVSRDVEFDEEGSWDWSIQESKRYDFLPMTDKEETNESSEEARQSQSPTPTQDSSSSSIFENAMKRKKCRKAIDGEIRPIERKDTWKLTTLLKGQKAIEIKSLYNAKTKRQRRSEKVQGKDCGKRWKIHQMDEKSKIDLAKNLVYHHRNEASEVIISFIKKTQVNLQLQVQRVRTDNGTEFKNKTLAKFFDEVGITQQFSAARTPQQNGVVERRNRTLVEAARTMLTFTNLPLFFGLKPSQ